MLKARDRQRRHAYGGATVSPGESEWYELPECAEQPEARRIRPRSRTVARPACVPKHYQRASILHFQHAGERAGAPGVLSLDYLASYYLRDYLAVVAVGT